MKIYLQWLWCVVLVICGCSGQDENQSVTAPESDVMLITKTVLTPSYIGNGPQWGGYDVVKAWTGQATLTEEDWNTLFRRVSFMRPGFMRVMVSQGWNYMEGDTFSPEKSDAVLGRILDYCQAHGITVQLGEWGHVGGSGIDAGWVERATDFLSYLLQDKGYSCIRYYTIVNEPNGDWSSTTGNYALWKNIIRQFYAVMETKGLTGRVQIMGPDAAVWTLGETAWVTNTRRELSREVQAFDIHTYPDNESVHNTSFLKLLEAYKAASDPAAPMILGELGFKYKSGSALDKANQSRIKADPFAADDSQMHVYDAFYGIDMADATIQVMLAAFAGVTYWDLDDAMYNDDGSSGSVKLKRWGFWNILGNEKFGNPDDEKIRPWFYTASLLCRYFPAGTEIRHVKLPVPVKSELRAVAGIKDGKMTIALVNSGNTTHSFRLSSEEPGTFAGIKTYRYVAGQGGVYTGTVDADGFAIPVVENGILDLSSGAGIDLELPGQSFVLFTNMD